MPLLFAETEELGTSNINEKSIHLEGLKKKKTTIKKMILTLQIVKIKQKKLLWEY